MMIFDKDGKVIAFLCSKKDIDKGYDVPLTPPQKRPETEKEKLKRISKPQIPIIETENDNF